MKIVTLIIALFALSFAAYADPVYAPATLTVPTVTSGATSNSVAVKLDVRKQNNVTLQWKVNDAVMGAGTNVTANFGASIDGSTFSTNAYSVTINATTAPNGVFVTNLTVNGAGYLRLDSITATGVAATNTVKYGIKIP